MPGFMPGIHVFFCGQWSSQDVDGRNKSSHDALCAINSVRYLQRQNRTTGIAEITPERSGVSSANIDPGPTNKGRYAKPTNYLVPIDDMIDTTGQTKNFNPLWRAIFSGNTRNYGAAGKCSG
jgi:hypothetical protein